MAFKEKELEDFIWSNPQCLHGLIGDPLGEGDHELQPLGRQVSAPCGIIDLIFSAHFTIYIIELKAHKAGDKELGQLSRYHDYISGAIYDLSPFDPCDSEDQNWAYFYMLPDIAIRKVLVATSFDDLLSYTSPLTCSFIEAKKVGNQFALSAYQQWTSQSKNNELVNALAPFAHHIANYAHDKCKFNQQIENAKIEKAIRTASTCAN